MRSGVTSGSVVVCAVLLAAGAARAQAPAPPTVAGASEYACSELPITSGDGLRAGIEDFEHGRFWAAAERLDRYLNEAPAPAVALQQAELLLAKSLFKHGLRTAALERLAGIAAAGASHSQHHKALTWIATLVVEPPRVSGAAAALADYASAELGAPELEPFRDVLHVELARHFLRHSEPRRALEVLERREARQLQLPLPPPWTREQLDHTAWALAREARAAVDRDAGTPAAGATRAAESDEEVAAMLAGLSDERQRLAASPRYCRSTLRPRILDLIDQRRDALSEESDEPRYGVKAGVLGGVFGGYRAGPQQPHTNVPAIGPDQYLARPDPRLPYAVKQRYRGKRGIAFFAAVCTRRDGVVDEVRVLQGIPGADYAIVDTIRTWRLKPQPIPICFLVRLVYDVTP